MENRKPTQDELNLIELLINNSSTKIPSEWKINLRVKDMDDGGMRGLYLFNNLNLKNRRIFGKSISEYHFVDEDGVKVIVSLYLDELGNLFELDIWKTDFTPLKKFPILKGNK